jgi:Uma2 family endonuclease
MATVSRTLTYEEWLQLPPVEDGTDEVVNGELRFMPPTRYPHAEIIRLLIDQLFGQVDKTKVSILGSKLGLMISREPLTCRSPDLIMFWREQMRIVDGMYCSPPGLIVEVLSPSENRAVRTANSKTTPALASPKSGSSRPKRTVSRCRS